MILDQLLESNRIEKAYHNQVELVAGMPVNTQLSEDLLNQNII